MSYLNATFKCSWVKINMAWMFTDVSVNRRGRGLCKVTSHFTDSLNDLLWDTAYDLWGLKKQRMSSPIALWEAHRHTVQCYCTTGIPSSIPSLWTSPDPAPHFLTPNLVSVIVPSKKLKRQNGKNVILKKEQEDFYHYSLVVHVHTLLTHI